MFDFLRRKNKANSHKTKRIFNKGQYKIVDGFTQAQIGQSSIETLNEDQILDNSKRGKLLDITRNLVRNSSLFSTLLLQLDSNVVGTCGGKVILNFQNEQLNKNLKKYFADFTRNADFYDGSTFNQLLKTYLKQQIVGGDLVIVFDHDIEGSGKLLYFESDEIVNVSQDVIDKHYGEGCIQSLGKVYSPNGRWIGTVVSRTSRGMTEADEDSCWFLKRDPNGNPLTQYWIQPTTSWRKSTRGVSQAATAVNTATQLEDLVLSELEASRKNAQTFCFIKSEMNEQEDEPSAFDEDADLENMTDEEIEKIVKDENDGAKQFSLQAAHENSVAFQQLPSGYSADLVDTKHPNSNVEQMTQYLAGRVGAVLGFSRAYATGNPTNEDFRAQQLLTAPAIIQYQKDLEKICDWVFYNTVIWLDKHNLFDISQLPEDFMQYVSWEWKKLDSCDEVATENANALKLKNMTGSYSELLGNNWKEKLLQIAAEAKWMTENGLVHPSNLLKSGGETMASQIAAITNEEE